MITKLTKVCNSDVRLSGKFFQKTWTCYDKYASIFRIYTTFLGRSKMSILLDDWS